MDAELSERVLVCLRGCEIGESISADGIADEIGEIGGKLSDVYDALEDLENAKLVEMHPACRKGSDPTYTLTPKGKRHMQPEIQEQPRPEPVKEDHAVQELRPSADRVCRFCGKVLEPNKVRRHERFCIKNPDRDMPGKAPKHALPEPVPAPAEYAEESNATHVLDYEVSLGGHITTLAGETDFPATMPEEAADVLPFAPNPDHCSACGNYSDGTCVEGCRTDGDCNIAWIPAKPQLQDVPSVEEILGQQQAAEDPDVPDEVPPLEAVLRIAKCDALVLKGSPGMDAALRLIAFCQKMAGSGAQVSVDATVQVSKGFHIHVDLCVPAPKEESDE